MKDRKIVKAFSLTTDLADWLDEYSKSEGISKSHIVRELLSILMEDIERNARNVRVD